MINLNDVRRKNLKRLLEQSGIEIRELAKRIKTSPQYINNILNEGKGFSDKKAVVFARAFDVPEYEFYRGLEGDNFSLTEMPAFQSTPIPVISKIHAGHWEEVIDNYPPGASEEAEPVFSRKTLGPNAFALVVEGDSMEPRFMAGDIVIIDPSLECRSGSVCVVKIRDDVTLKVFRDTNGEYRFDPTNDKYPSTVISKDGKTPFRIIGPVVELVPKIS